MPKTDDEQTRTADLLITSERSGVAWGCKHPIFKPVSLPSLALRCTELRFPEVSQWCQKYVKFRVNSCFSS